MKWTEADLGRVGRGGHRGTKARSRGGPEQSRVSRLRKERTSGCRESPQGQGGRAYLEVTAMAPPTREIAGNGHGSVLEEEWWRERTERQRF